MRIRLLPYKQGSKGARALADALEGRVLKIVNSRFRPRAEDLLINWGSSRDSPEGWDRAITFNQPAAVKVASNKLAFFDMLTRMEQADIIPAYWTSKEDIPEDAYPIVCRTVLSGHSGAGIVIANSEDELVGAPLYVKYIKKKSEYRVHVGTANKIIAVQRKARRRETPDSEVNWMIRNHSNGFVFVRNNVEAPASVLDVAKRALEASGLDFGAVDVVFHERENRAYVLEINTAPGLEGSTVEDYANYFREVINEQEQGDS